MLLITTSSKHIYLDHLQHLYTQQQQQWLILLQMNLHVSYDQHAAKPGCGGPLQFEIIDNFSSLGF